MSSWGMFMLTPFAFLCATQNSSRADHPGCLRVCLVCPFLCCYYITTAETARAQQLATEVGNAKQAEKVGVISKQDPPC